MIIKNNKTSKIIHNLDDWRNEFFSDQKSKHWKPRRSAMSTALFWLNEESINGIRNLLSGKIPEITFDEAYPEIELKFDDYRNGRENDLLVTCNDSKTLISVEAKTDEGFSNNKTYLDALYDAIDAKRDNNNSKQPERLFDLYKNYFCCNNEIFTLMHQLAYWYAGSIAEGIRQKSVNIILVNQVFYYSELDTKKLVENKKAFEKLVKIISNDEITAITKNILYGPINNQYTKNMNVYFIKYFVDKQSKSQMEK